MSKQAITTRILKTGDINWRELSFIQDENFKELPQHRKQKLKQSIIENPFSDPFKVWYCESSGLTYCLDGKHRTIILEELAAEGYEVPENLPAVFLDCADIKEAAKLVLIYSSVYAYITEDGLFNFMQAYEFSPDDLKMPVEIPELDMMNVEALFADTGEITDIVPKSLQERFIIPPFSIFDTRQGYWQDRKRHWLQMGFDSQETREDVELIAKSGQAPAVYELRNKMRKALGREPEWDEIIAEAEKRGMHIYSGASIFDPVLCEVAYRWFCPDGGTILDPFAGGSVRGIVAGMLGLNYWGIDIRPEQVDVNRKQWAPFDQPGKTGVVHWEAADSNVKLDEFGNSFDFIFSCPPYHDLEQYSDNPADLSNMDYPEFIQVYRSIIKKSVARLKENRFACFVVGDFRDKAGFYRDFVGDTVQAFRDAGAELYNEIILVTVAGSLPVRIGRQFEGYRKVGKMHQNVLIFYKGDPKKIKEEFPEIKVTEYLQELNYQPNIALTTTG